MGRRTARALQAKAVDLPCSTSDASGEFVWGGGGNCKVDGTEHNTQWRGLPSMEAAQATLTAIESTASIPRPLGLELQPRVEHDDQGQVPISLRAK